jgi:thiamine-phosphate pyrophosphorylase
MDTRLVAWARAVKARNRHRQAAQPALWLFTDARRLPDPRAAVAALPRGLCGVVLRHDGEPGRAALAHDLARICRIRRLALVVAGDVRLAAAVGAGVHLRGGRWPGPVRIRGRWLTSSAHTPPELRRAAQAGARLAFLAPAFATASHPGAAGLGAARWSRLAGCAGLPVVALGGIDGRTARRLSRQRCRGAGAIAALAG